MAVRKDKPATKPRPDIRTAAIAFHDIVDGNEVFADLEKAAEYLALSGVEVISPRRGILDGDYKPVSRIEQLLEERFPGGGVNGNDLVFAVEKDGYETLVFEHGGQMSCSNWVLDRESGKLEFVAIPDVVLKLNDAVRDVRPFANSTDEEITGGLARQFVFKAKWDAALDFKVDGWPEFKGLRFKKVGGEEVVHAMFWDGTNGTFDAFGIERAMQLDAALAGVRKKIDKILKHRNAKPLNISRARVKSVKKEAPRKRGPKL